VDLPRLFEEELGSLPGRQFFFDYCHHNSAGMRWAMAFTAAKLLASMGQNAPGFRMLYDAAPEPEPGVDAEAHLLAALHNQRWGQSGIRVKELLEEATALDGRLKEALECGEMLRSTRVPAALAECFWKLVQKDVLSRRALKWLAAESRAEDDAEVFRAFHPTSEFTVRSEGPMQLQLVARVPGARERQRIHVTVNGQMCASLPATQNWREHLIAVDTARAEANQVRVRWPEPERSQEEEYSRIVGRVRATGKPDFRSLYGEIHALQGLPP